MALNGNSPIIVIQAYNNIINKGNNGAQGETRWASNIDTGQDNHLGLISGFKKWQDVRSIKQLRSGVPIPFILHERSGIISVKEQKNISLNLEYEKGIKYQRQRQNSLSIEIQFNTENIIANTLASLLEYWWGQADEYNYDISYFNAGNFIKQGQIGSFTKTSDSDLGVVNLTLDAGDNFIVNLKKEDEKKEKTATVDFVSRKDEAIKSGTIGV